MLRTCFVAARWVANRRLPVGVRTLATNKTTTNASSSTRNRWGWKPLAAVGTVFTGSALAYLYFFPERHLWRKTRYKFDRFDYAAQLFLFRKMPVPKLPILDVTGRSGIPSMTLAEWADNIRRGESHLIHSLPLKTWQHMRDVLLAAIAQEPDVAVRLRELRQVLPESLELRLEVEAQLSREMDLKQWLPSELLQENAVVADASSSSLRPYSPVAQMLGAALLSFPGPVDECIQVMLGSKSTDALMASVAPLLTLPEQQTAVRASVAVLKRHFDALHPVVQRRVLEQAVATALSQIKALKCVRNRSVIASQEFQESRSGITLRDLLHKHLLAQLSADEHIRPWVPHMVTVFEQLPLETQSKMVVSALQIGASVHDSQADSAVQKKNRLLLVRRLLSDFGLVGIKAGQDLAGHAEVPAEYRQALADLRDRNEPMGYGEFWQRIPPPFRRRLAKLGRRLGVGSVKQVHLALMELADGRQVEVAVGLIGQGVEDDVVSGLQALAALPEFAGLRDKIRGMIEPELNLRADAQSFVLTRQTALGNGTVPCLYVPEVWDSTMTCVIREVAAGPTVAKLLAPGTNGDAATARLLVQCLGALHVTGVRTGLATTPTAKGLISSDLHPGNIVFQEASRRLVLIDTGQHDWISHRESTAFLWTLAALCDQVSWRKFAPMALDQLAQVAEVRPVTLGQSMTQPVAGHIQQRLWRALQQCQQEPNIQMRFTQLLRAVDAEGLCLPSGFVSAGKMLDVFRAQEMLLGMPPWVDQEVERLLKQRISWRQAPYVLWRSWFC